MQTYFSPGPSSKRQLSAYVSVFPYSFHTADPSSKRQLWCYLFIYCFICRKENELLTRYPRKYKLGKIRMVYCRYMRNRRSNVSSEVFSIIVTIIRENVTVIPATFSFNLMLRCMLKSIVGRKYVQQCFSTCNATMFRLQVAAICCSYFFTVTQSEPWLETLDLAFRTSAVHQHCAFWFVFQHCLRRTPHVYCTNWELLLYVEGPNRGFHGILTICGNDLERYKVSSSFIIWGWSSGVEFCFHVEL